MCHTYLPTLHVYALLTSLVGNTLFDQSHQPMYFTSGWAIDHFRLGIFEPLLGVYAPYSFHNFTPCPLFLSICCQLLPFTFFLVPFLLVYAACSFPFLSFLLDFFSCSMLPFRIFLCSLLQNYHLIASYSL